LFFLQVNLQKHIVKLTSSKEAELPSDPRSLPVGHLSWSEQSTTTFSNSSSSSSSSSSSNILTTCRRISPKIIRSFSSVDETERRRRRPSPKNNLSLLSSSALSCTRRWKLPLTFPKTFCIRIILSSRSPYSGKLEVVVSLLSSSTSFEQQKSFESLNDLKSAEVNVRDLNATCRSSWSWRPPSWLKLLDKQKVDFDFFDLAPSLRLLTNSRLFLLPSSLLFSFLFLFLFSCLEDFWRKTEVCSVVVASSSSAPTHLQRWSSSSLLLLFVPRSSTDRDRGGGGRVSKTLQSKFRILIFSFRFCSSVKLSNPSPKCRSKKSHSLILKKLRLIVRNLHF